MKGNRGQYYSGFSPSSIPGCALWLDGADTTSMTFSGSNVTQWSDKSGNSRHATTSTSANPPVYNSTTKCLQFTSTSSQSLTIAQSFGNLLVGTKFSLFAVGRRRSSLFTGFLSGNTAILNSNFFLYFSGTTYGGGYYAGNVAQGTVPAYVNPDPVYLMGFDSLSTQLQATLNGAIVGTGAASDLLSFAGPSIGRRYGGTGDQVYHDMDVFEMISFVPPVSTTQRQQLEGYLATKWGTRGNLPATHPFKSLPPLL